ncbi:hypothetical protein G6514_002556 [Epicoccum nigrum]|nr:hypothetical protein G6514_002556 [Epicoccum nigrum]
MFGVVDKLFAPRGPLFNVAGIRLTKDETTELIQTCNVLARFLNIQIETIQSLSSLPDFQAGRVIIWIQTRQIDINTHLSAIIFRIKSSACPWINEFSDARTALDGKVRTISKFSTVNGWVPGARVYWPCMIETYEWLLPLTLRLREESEEALQEQEQQ